MPRYIVSSPSARKRGAIGIFYEIKRYVRAETPEQAIKQYREEIECNGPPTATLANYPEYDAEESK